LFVTAAKILATLATKTIILICNHLDRKAKPILRTIPAAIILRRWKEVIAGLSVRKYMPLPNERSKLRNTQALATAADIGIYACTDPVQIQTPGTTCFKIMAVWGPGGMADVFDVDQFHAQHGLRFLHKRAHLGSGQSFIQYLRQSQHARISREAMESEGLRISNLIKQLSSATLNILLKRGLRLLTSCTTIRWHWANSQQCEGSYNIDVILILKYMWNQMQSESLTRQKGPHW
jgi:hypothetical protein